MHITFYHFRVFLNEISVWLNIILRWLNKSDRFSSIEWEISQWMVKNATNRLEIIFHRNFEICVAFAQYLSTLQYVHMYSKYVYVCFYVLEQNIQISEIHVKSIECRMSNEHQSPTKFLKPTATQNFHESFHIKVDIDFHHCFCYRCKNKTSTNRSDRNRNEERRWDGKMFRILVYFGQRIHFQWMA